MSNTKPIDAEKCAREIRKRILQITSKYPLGLSERSVVPAIQYARGQLHAYETAMSILRSLVAIEEESKNAENRSV